MRHPDLAARERSCLLVVDVQEALLRVIFEPERVLENCCQLARGARILGLPILVTTQYAARLGLTAPDLAEALGQFALDKLTFSCCEAEGFCGRLAALQRDTVIVCGVEAHVCVNQTVLDLLASGYRVHTVADATSSRAVGNCQAGLEKMRAAGAIITTTEIVLFELLQRAGTPEFRAVQSLVE